MTTIALDAELFEHLAQQTADDVPIVAAVQARMMLLCDHADTALLQTILDDLLVGIPLSRALENVGAARSLFKAVATAESEGRLPDGLFEAARLTLLGERNANGAE